MVCMFHFDLPMPYGLSIQIDGGCLMPCRLHVLNSFLISFSQAKIDFDERAPKATSGQLARRRVVSEAHMYCYRSELCSFRINYSNVKLYEEGGKYAKLYIISKAMHCNLPEL